MIRLYAFAVIALAIGGLLWHDHYLSRKYKTAQAEATQLSASLLAEQENRKHERELNAKIDQQLLDANKALDLERAKPLPRLQCRRLPVSTSGVPSAATASTIDSPGTEGHDGESLEEDFDPSEQLLQYAVDAEENENTLKACQAWVMAR